jgi:hypothetical protein
MSVIDLKFWILSDCVNNTYKYFFILIEKILIKCKKNPSFHSFQGFYKYILLSAFIVLEKTFISFYQVNDRLYFMHNSLFIRGLK